MKRSTGVFRYAGLDIDEREGVVVCRYRLDGWRFEERVTLGPGRNWAQPAVAEAARLVALLAGVSYYKTLAPPVVDLGDMVVRAGDVDFLAAFYRDGLGEYAYRNGLSLDDLTFTGGRLDGPPVAFDAPLDRPLVPFGGGIDSIVTVEIVRAVAPDAALFIMNRAGDRFAAIEGAAAATALPVVRAEREIDPQLLRSADLGFLNGHVPVTGILSAVAVLAAVLDGRGAVVMSNEWSASSGNLAVDGRIVNHQYSKSLAFEDAFRSVLRGAVGGGFEYFSELRPFSELWVARRFAELTRYHAVFHSCNRAFHLDPDRRQVQWCGRCDKCCFIDLILSPFLDVDALAAVFGGHEPLTDASLVPQFRALLELSDDPKPFECVGDVRECRSALRAAAARPDRAANRVVQALAGEVGERAPDPAELLGVMGPHHVPDAFLPV